MNYLKLSKDLLPIIDSYNDHSIINMKKIAEKNINKTIFCFLDPDITITDIIFRVLQFGATGIFISKMTDEVNEEFKKKIKNSQLLEQNHDRKQIWNEWYRSSLEYLYQLGLIKYTTNDYNIKNDSNKEFILNDKKL